MYSLTNHYEDGMETHHPCQTLNFVLIMIGEVMPSIAGYSHSVVEYPGGKCIVRPRVKS